MKIGVIGEPCVDYIHFPDGKFFKSYGGILYSLISMSVLANSFNSPDQSEPGRQKEGEKENLAQKERNVIYPIFNLGRDEYQQMIDYLSRYKNIDIRFIKQVEHSTRVVKLFYNKEALNEDATVKANHPKTYDREENSTEPTFPVDYDWIKGVINEPDALLINMVSGVDITIDTLKQLRQNFKGYIHMDIHNIVMRTDEFGNRTRGFLPNWLEWCTNCNTLQMNESELRAIGNNTNSEEDTVKEILFSNNSGQPEAILITRGKYGVTLFYKENNELMIYEEPPIIRTNSSDPTGCGDTFASAFLLSNLKNNKDYKASLRYANNIASIKATLRGVDELYKLNQNP